MANEEDVGSKAVKRYEGLITLRTKSIEGKGGAWYWTYFEPILTQNPETNQPKAAMLKCTLCASTFSASNPSRTANEHLKKGTCPNFNSPFSQNHHHHHHRRRSFTPSSSSSVLYPLQSQRNLLLSGGKDDFSALAMLEDSVKKLKRPKPIPAPSLTLLQVHSAIDTLSHWFYESYGSVSISALQHPKFKAFLNQVGLIAVTQKDILGSRLESRFRNVKMESESRINESPFFQVASDGWKIKNRETQKLVRFFINLPNGSSVFHKTCFVAKTVPSEYAEEILRDSLTKTGNDNIVHRCVGIVTDKYKMSALRNLEIEYPWMVNLSCQIQAFISLIKDFITHLPIFKSVVDNCSKLTNNRFHNDVEFFIPMLDDVHKSTIPVEDAGFRNNLEAVRSLTKMMKGMADEIRLERPLVSQCLPLWDELRGKVKEWCAKFNVDLNEVETILERRFDKNYHPAWSAAFILDPRYLLRDENGKYVPPYQYLTVEQEKDVERVITSRLVSKEEIPIALMELKRWRIEGLDPLYAKAVQVKEKDTRTGKMKMANPSSSRLVWETCLKDLETIGKVAVKLLFLHGTASCGFNKVDWGSLRVCEVGLESVEKMVFIATQAKLERRDFSSDEQGKDTP
ncbi:uncharacterized protein LOC124925191 [Impatiens glandulifera]|uniref:uncharacterized protein LOC124925191 n=1 Tax=Impatiens glandulifera TaxID=253017 RepID=UPI001FB12DD5|nr:uncharacterized protein LOC124925191 [Impatiens glandulifera]